MPIPLKLKWEPGWVLYQLNHNGNNWPWTFLKAFSRPLFQYSVFFHTSIYKIRHNCSFMLLCESASCNLVTINSRTFVFKSYLSGGKLIFLPPTTHSPFSLPILFSNPITVVSLFIPSPVSPQGVHSLLEQFLWYSAAETETDKGPDPKTPHEWHGWGTDLRNV